jgi:hypothetical protein
MNLLFGAINKARAEWGCSQIPDCKVTRPKAPPHRDRVLSDEEEVILVAAARANSNEYLAPVIEWALATAMRAGEIVNLLWSDIAWKKRTCRVREAKNGTPRNVPLRQFLGNRFHWRDRLAKTGTALEVVRTLHEMVRGGSVVVILEDAPGGVGMNWPPRQPNRSSFWGVENYDESPYVSVKERYQAQLEKMNAERPTWAETQVMMDGMNVEFMQAMFRILPVASAIVFSQAGWISKYGVPDLSGIGVDGDSETAMDGSTALGDAQPFECAEEAVTGETEELAASTNNPKFAAKMLGYDQKTFGDILHRFKPDNGLGPADNVIWHDNDDVYFNGNFLANFHDWAN